MKVTNIFIQARLGSERLPRKVILPVNDRPMIYLLTRRLCSLLKKKVSAIAVLTSRQSEDAINDALTDLPVKVFVGSEQNVLKRYRDALDAFPCDTIIRATGDNPFVSLEYIENLIENHVQDENDLSTYADLPLGTGVELIESAALAKAAHDASTTYQKEHVTPFIYDHPELFQIGQYYPLPSHRYPNIRLTVDEPDDYKLIKILAERLPDKDLYGPNLDKLIHLFNENPDLAKINANVKQRSLKK